MKYLMTSLAFLLCLSSLDILAQRYPKSEKEANLEAMASLLGIYQKNSSIWLSGNRLSKEELSAMEGFDINLYSKGRIKTGVGTALISIGAVPCAIGTVGLVGTIQESARINSERKDGIEPIPGSGLPQATMFLGYGIGVLLEAVGIPLYCSGKADIRHAAVSYNRQKGIQCSIVPSTSGFGIALHF
ncbi:MAG: hypothetical protein MJY55_07030 [Bacteroidales bacterium]|nr:hypothetical protein [Bacteroidales bacterium]